MTVEYVSPITKKPINADELFNVCVNDFGDNYHRLAGEPSSELERRVRRLRRRYRNMHEYHDACRDYEEWMEFLYSKHGGEKMFNAKLREGLIWEFVPHKPRLKLNKELKFFIKNDIILSEVPKNPEYRWDLVEEYVENEYNFSPDSLDKYTFKTSHEFMDELKKNSMSVITKEMNKAKYEFNVDAEMEYLDKYFTNKNDGKWKKDKKKKLTKKEKKKLKKQMKKDQERLNFWGEEKFLLQNLVDASNVEDTTERDEEDEGFILYNGRFITKKEKREVEMYELLAEHGWNSYKIMSHKKYGKKKAQEWKKHEKSKKKKKKGSKGADRLLIDMMEDNGFDDFGDFMEEMQNFTMDSYAKFQ